MGVSGFPERRPISSISSLNSSMSSTPLPSVSYTWNSPSIPSISSSLSV
jgi:hypothetical protein